MPWFLVIPQIHYSTQKQVVTIFVDTWPYLGGTPHFGGKIPPQEMSRKNTGFFVLFHDIALIALPYRDRAITLIISRNCTSYIEVMADEWISLNTAAG